MLRKSPGCTSCPSTAVMTKRATPSARTRGARRGRHAGPRHGSYAARHARLARSRRSCWTKRTRCCAWASSTMSSGSWGRRHPIGRSRSSRPRCRATARARSSTRGSCPRRARTRPASSRAWPPSWPPTPRSGTISSSCAAAGRAQLRPVHLVRDAFPEAGDRAVLTLVVGVGNPWRGDDAAGLELARRVAGTGVEVRTVEGDASGLLDAWAGHEHVALVDAAAPATCPGALHTFRADRAPLPAAGLRSSTHAFGVADAVEPRARSAASPPAWTSTPSRARSSSRRRDLRPPSRARSRRSRERLRAPRAELRKPTVAAGGTPARVRTNRPMAHCGASRPARPSSRSRSPREVRRSPQRTRGAGRDVPGRPGRALASQDGRRRP